MPSDPPDSDSASPDSSPPGADKLDLSISQLLISFSVMSLSGFGGVLVFARRHIVEKKRWLSAEEFNEQFAFSQLLPGPNIVNFAVVFGARHRGVAGGVAAFLGLVAPAAAVAMVLAAIYARIGDSEVLQRILNGTAIAALGLFGSVIAKMSVPLIRRRSLVAAVVVGAVFVAIAVMLLPMPMVLVVAVPASIALAWATRKATPL